MTRSMWLFALALFVIAIIGSACLASETQWNCNLRLYTGSVGGSPMDTAEFLGVRPGATDLYDSAYDSSKPPAPQPPMVYMYWYRSWGGNKFLADYRAVIPSGSSKTWEDLRTECNPGVTLYLSWTLGTTSAWLPPDTYAFTVYDEGTAPNPTGGMPVDMRTTTSISWAQAAQPEVHYFHVLVNDDRVGTPVITSPANGSSSSDATITVSGTASDDTYTIEVFCNGISQGTTTVTGGTWTKSGVVLTNQSNSIYATATRTDGVSSSPSNTIIVSLGPVWYPLPYAGWYMVAYPFFEPLNVWATKIYNSGTSETLGIVDALFAGWLSLPLSYYDTSILGYQTMGYDFSDVDQYFRPFVGYWLQTLQPNLYLLFPIAERTALSIKGNGAWTDTGIDLAEGQYFKVTATGLIDFKGGAGKWGPDGDFATTAPAGWPLPDYPSYCLIGKVGVAGTPFYVGSYQDPLVEPLKAPAGGGRLYLGLNDNATADNVGNWSGNVVTY